MSREPQVNRIKDTSRSTEKHLTVGYFGALHRDVDRNEATEDRRVGVCVTPKCLIENMDLFLHYWYGIIVKLSLGA